MTPVQLIAIVAMTKLTIVVPYNLLLLGEITESRNLVGMATIVSSSNSFIMQSDMDKTVLYGLIKIKYPATETTEAIAIIIWMFWKFSGRTKADA